MSLRGFKQLVNDVSIIKNESSKNLPQNGRKKGFLNIHLTKKSKKLLNEEKFYK